MPSIILGMVVFVFLPNSIETAYFLTPEEREVLAATVERDRVPGPLAHDLKGAWALISMVLHNGYFWLVFLSGLLMSIAAATYTTYTPIIISNLLAGNALNNKATVAAAKGSKSLTPVALSMVPFTLAVVFSYVVAASSQRRNEIFFHVFACLATAGVLMSLFSTLAAVSIPAGFVALSLSLAISFGATGPGMALVARLCKGREQVVAQPMSNTFNVMGGIFGPLITAALMNKNVGAVGVWGVRTSSVGSVRCRCRFSQLHGGMHTVWRLVPARCMRFCPPLASDLITRAPIFLPQTQGGFKWVAILMGILMLTTSFLLLVLRYWVMRDGGLPDGGTGRRYSERLDRSNGSWVAPGDDVTEGKQHQRQAGSTAV